MKNASEIAIDLVVPEAKDAKAFAAESRITTCVSRSMLIEIVLTAVQFNNQPVLHANEIDDKSVLR